MKTYLLHQTTSLASSFSKERFSHCKNRGFPGEISSVKAFFTPVILSVCFAISGSLMISHRAAALEVAVRGSTVQLPLERYRRAAGSLQLGFGSSESGFWTLETGATVPFRIGDYTQTVYFGSLVREWTPGQSTFLRPLVGFGLGAYADRVSDAASGRNSIGWMPSIVTRAGFRVGQRFGIHALFECQAGIYDFQQLTSWVIWPMTRLTGGIHVAF
jgi:hypothetical protein